MACKMRCKTTAGKWQEVQGYMDKSGNCRCPKGYLQSPKIQKIDALKDKEAKGTGGFIKMKTNKSKNLKRVDL